VRKQAARGAERLTEAMYPLMAERSRKMVAALDALLAFTERSRERLADPDWRYQFLAKVTTVVRDQVFDCFDAASAEKGLATLIINAANRMTARRLRKKHVIIFRDSLLALRHGQADPNVIRRWKKKLLEIDA